MSKCPDATALWGEASLNALNPCNPRLRDDMSCRHAPSCCGVNGILLCVVFQFSLRRFIQVSLQRSLGLGPLGSCGCLTIVYAYFRPGECCRLDVKCYQSDVKRQRKCSYLGDCMEITFVLHVWNTSLVVRAHNADNGQSQAAL